MSGLDEAGVSRRVPNLLHAASFVAMAFLLLLVFEAMVLPRGSVRLELAAEPVTYLVTLGLAALVYPMLWRVPFWRGVGWNARGVRWWHVLLGLGLGFASQAVSQFITTSGPLPIEQMFKDRGTVWGLAVFGTTLAPVFEEVLFRGMLLPAVAHAVDWLRLPKEPGTVEAWRGSEGNSALALWVAAGVTSVLFALLHGAQLGWTWGAVALLAVVSLGLCWVRARARSVAASTVVHACYNLTVFMTLWFATGGFRHLEKVS